MRCELSTVKLVSTHAWRHRQLALVLACAMSTPALAADCVNGINTAGCTVPAGVTSVTVKAWGGGGGGGAAGVVNVAPFTSYGGGGGGGSFCGGTFTVTPGETVSISVGSGGVGGTDNFHMQGANGGTTTVSGAGITGVTVNGGSYGYAGGGAGGTTSGCSATAKYAGGSGSASLKVGANTNIADASGGAGGSAASTANGNSATLTPFGAAAVGDGGAGGAGDVPTWHNPAILQAGSPGGLPGGGGGGGGAGGTGGDGKVLLSFAVNGACGAVAATAFAPSSGLCTSGTPSAVASGSPWTWSCTGSGGGTTASCSAPNASTATSSGTGRAVVEATNGWVVDAANSGFVSTGSLSGAPALPPGVTFPHGLMNLRLITGNAGTAATVTITYPTALPAGTVYWKYGRTASNTTAHWYQFAGAAIAGNTITLTLTDGADGDDDMTANRVISDPGGPGVPETAIPTLSEWGLIMLAGLMGLFGMARLRQLHPDPQTGRARR